MLELDPQTRKELLIGFALLFVFLAIYYLVLLLLNPVLFCLFISVAGGTAIGFSIALLLNDALSNVNRRAIIIGSVLLAVVLCTAFAILLTFIFTVKPLLFACILVVVGGATIGGIIGRFVDNLYWSNRIRPAVNESYAIINGTLEATVNRVVSTEYEPAPAYVTRFDTFDPNQPLQDHVSVIDLSKITVVKASNGKYYNKSKLDLAHQNNQKLHITYDENLDIVPNILKTPFKENVTECPLTLSRLSRKNAVRTRYGHYFDKDTLIREISISHRCSLTRYYLADTANYIKPISTPSLWNHFCNLFQANASTNVTEPEDQAPSLNAALCNQ